MVSSASLESYGHFLLKACCNQLDLGEKMLGIVSTLIGKGADVNARDDYGNTPLHWACHALRKLDADEQATTMPYGLRLVLLLLQNGANKEACNHRGWTPLHYAAVSCLFVRLVHLFLLFFLFSHLSFSLLHDL